LIFLSKAIPAPIPIITGTIDLNKHLKYFLFLNKGQTTIPAKSPTAE